MSRCLRLLAENIQMSFMIKKKYTRSLHKLSEKNDRGVGTVKIVSYG